MMGRLSCRFASSSSCPDSSLSSPRNSEKQNVLIESFPRFSSYTKSIVSIEKGLLTPQDSNGSIKPKSSEDLRKEIASLEFEILRMEQCLLSLYRTAFDEQVSSFSPLKGTSLPCALTSSVAESNQFCTKFEKSDLTNEFDYRYQASPIYKQSFSYPRSFNANSKALSARVSKSKTTGFLQFQAPDESGKIYDLQEETRFVCGKSSLGDLLRCSSRVDTNLVNPSRLSEDILRCIASVYCTFSSKTKTNSCLQSSSPSSISSSSIFSSKTTFDSWSLNCSEEPKLNQRLEESKEANLPCGVVIESLKLHLNDDSFNYISLMLQNFRSLVQKLEKVDPSRMKREEKLAFWINIHNSLMMHAYLAYGTNNRARISSVMKAAYDIGGYRVNPYIIQSLILGIQPHYSPPLLQTLFSPSRKSKTSHVRHIYALEYPEALVHFALSSGALTDPPVRVYTADSLFRDLIQAKEEYIQSNVCVQNGTKILLPKILHYYAKDMSLDTYELMETMVKCLPEAAKRITQKWLKEKKKKKKMSKIIEWSPENSSFRYVIIGELAGERIKN